MSEWGEYESKQKNWKGKSNKRVRTENRDLILGTQAIPKHAKLN